MEYLEPEYQKNLEIELNNKNEKNNNLNNISLYKSLENQEENFENYSNLKKQSINNILNPIKYYNNNNQNEYSKINNKYQDNISNNFNKIKKKRGNFILRQEINSYTPSCNPKCGIISNFIFMICCLGIGIPQVIYSKKYLEYKINYTNCKPNNSNNICNITFKIDKKLNSKVLIYYQLNNFYLNYRKFVKSKNWAQLRGEDADCDNLNTMEEMFGNDSVYYTNEWNHTFDKKDQANPCGLFARSFFNDSYELYKIINEKNEIKKININEKNISNKYLREKFFKKNKNYKNKQWIDVENEHFINWMNVETFHNFRKLWGRIEEDLDIGNYTVLIKNNYDISQYNAEKFVVLCDSNIFGEVIFFGYFLIIIASYCFLVILILWVLILSNREKMFDINIVKWN